MGYINRSLPIIMPSDAYSDYSESGEDSPYNTVNIDRYILYV